MTIYIINKGKRECKSIDKKLKYETILLLDKIFSRDNFAVKFEKSLKNY